MSGNEVIYLSESFWTDLVKMNVLVFIVFAWIGFVIYYTIQNRKKEKWNCVMLIAVTVCSVYLAYPLLLSNSLAFDAANKYFSELGLPDYKSSFLESIGGLLGNFLAIAGALWADRQLKKMQEDDDDALNARVIFYDFLFVFEQLSILVVDVNDKGLIKARITRTYKRDFYSKIMDMLASMGGEM